MTSWVDPKCNHEVPNERVRRTERKEEHSFSVYDFILKIGNNFLHVSFLLELSHMPQLAAEVPKKCCFYLSDHTPS